MNIHIYNEDQHHFNRPELREHTSLAVDPTFYIEQWEDDFFDLMISTDVSKEGLPLSEPLDFYKLLVFYGQFARIRDEFKNTNEIREILQWAGNEIERMTDQNYHEALGCFQPKEWLAQAETLYNDWYEEKINHDEAVKRTSVLFIDLDDVLLVLAQSMNRLGFDALEEYRNSIQPCLDWYENDDQLFVLGTHWILEMTSAFQDNFSDYSDWDLTEMYFLIQMDKLGEFHQWMTKPRDGVSGHRSIRMTWEYEVRKMKAAGVYHLLGADVEKTDEGEIQDSCNEPQGDFFWKSPDGKYIAKRNYVKTSSGKNVLRMIFKHANLSDADASCDVVNARFRGKTYQLNENQRFEEENFEEQSETIDEDLIGQLEVRLHGEEQFTVWEIQYGTHNQ